MFAAKKAMRTHKANPLNRTLAFRVSESDYQLIKMEAAASGIKRSELIRELLNPAINGSTDQN
jgi:predicted DNA binding CopG/RHH family protein